MCFDLNDIIPAQSHTERRRDLGSSLSNKGKCKEIYRLYQISDFTHY